MIVETLYFETLRHIGMKKENLNFLRKKTKTKLEWNHLTSTIDTLIPELKYLKSISLIF